MNAQAAMAALSPGFSPTLQTLHNVLEKLPGVKLPLFVWEVCFNLTAAVALLLSARSTPGS